MLRISVFNISCQFMSGFVFTSMRFANLEVSTSIKEIYRGISRCVADFGQYFHVHTLTCCLRIWVEVYFVYNCFLVNPSFFAKSLAIPDNASLFRIAQVLVNALIMARWYSKLFGLDFACISDPCNPCPLVCVRVFIIINIIIIICYYYIIFLYYWNNKLLFIIIACFVLVSVLRSWAAVLAVRPS